jgi:hypothetical protein
MRGERSLTIPLVAACALHAAAVVILAASGASPRSAPFRPPPQTSEIEILSESAQPPVVGEAAPAKGPAVHPAEPARVVGAARGQVDVGRGETAATAPSEEPTWSFSPIDPAHADAGAGLAELESATRAGVRRVVAEAEARADADALRDAMRPGAGPVLTGAAGVLVPFTREAVRGSHAPMQGEVRLEYRVDAAGKVARVLVVDASASRSTWEEVAQDLTVQAGDRVVPVPAGAHGVAVLLDVSSYLASGSGVQGENSLKTSSPLQERFDTVHPEVPPATIRGGRPQQPRRLDLVIAPNQIDLTVQQGIGDLAVDGVVPARRVVAVRLVEERAL